MSTIRSLRSREIIDSRAQPTLEVDVLLQSGTMGRAAVPSGASTGAHEACELRDGDPQRFAGRGVLKAAQNVEQRIAPQLVGHDVFDWQATDKLLNSLDTSANKSQLGANAILAVSLAAARAAANEKQQELFVFLKQLEHVSLPVPMFNVLNGGRHANNNLSVQEFMIVPKGVDSFRQALQMGCEVWGELKKLLHSKGLSTAVGDEGGFAPALKSNREALDVLVQAVERSNYKLGTQIVLAMDVAATEFSQKQSDGSYVYTWEGQRLSATELGQIYSQWLKQYPLYSIEDAFAEDDWQGWQNFSAAHKSQLQLVGDDIFVTQAGRLRKGIERGIANALLVKINQAGTLSETLEAVQMAQASDYECVMSHRSGETEDTSIADLAVAFGCRQIKMGSPCRSERVAKYNRLLRIEEMLTQNL